MRGARSSLRMWTATAPTRSSSARKRAASSASNRAAPGTGSHVRWANELDGIPGQAIFADVDGDRLGEILLPVSDGFSIA